MPYALVADVEALNRARKLGAGATMPTADDVALYLELAQGEIDGILVNKGYQLPIPQTATVARSLLRDLNAKGALMRLEKASPSAPNVDRVEKEYDTGLEKLADSSYTLPIPLETERARPRGPGLNVPRPSTLESEPFFRRRQIF